MWVLGRKQEPEWHKIQKGDGKMTNIIFLPLPMTQILSVSLFLTVCGYGMFNCEIARACFEAV